MYKVEKFVNLIYKKYQSDNIKKKKVRKFILSTCFKCFLFSKKKSIL